MCYPKFEMNLRAIISFVLNAIALVVGVVTGSLVFKLADYFSDLRSVLRSIIFQGTLSLLALYATSSGRSIFVSAFLLSALGASFYFQYQDKKRGELESWFWVLKERPSRSGLVIYFFVVGFLFLYSLLNLVM